MRPRRPGCGARVGASRRIVGAQKIGVAHEEAFAVVVGVDEPAGDVVGRGATDGAGRRIRVSKPSATRLCWRSTLSRFRNARISPEASSMVRAQFDEVSKADVFGFMTGAMKVA